MKNLYIYILLVLLLSSCTLDYDNPNAASESDLMDTEALIALAIGVQQQYSVEALDYVTFVPSLTTGETASILTNVANQEVEAGYDDLLGTNLRMINLFTALSRTKGMAELLTDNVPTALGDQGTLNGLLSWGYFFRALCLGTMVQYWEYAPPTNTLDGTAQYVDKEATLNEVISLLTQAKQTYQFADISSEFKAALESNIDLLNCINAYLSRYQVMAGRYADAIASADEVNLNSSSTFTFDDQNQNPVYVGMVRPGELLFYASQVGFGLEGGLAPEADDQRVPFYLTEEAGKSLTGKDVLLGNETPFFATATSEIPVFLPGEMLLNKAEAYFQLGQFDQALAMVNEIRTKSPQEDIYGIGAGLEPLSDISNEELWDEIYKNRRIELFLTGQSLEFSRRYTRPGPNSDAPERNRDYYPFPSSERLNNPNTPEDPTI